MAAAHFETSPVRCCFCDGPLRRDRRDPHDPESAWNPWQCWQPPCWDRAREWMIHSQETLANGRTKNTLLFGPTPKQVQFFEQTRRSKYTLFGGAKAVAKSYALRWLAYRDCLRIPHLKVLLLRRTFKELELSHLLDMPVEAAWLKPAGADYSVSSRTMRFGTQSLVIAGHCESDADVAHYLSSQWDRVLLDEIVTFPRDIALAILSCARSVKPQVIAEGGAQGWAATNPGGRHASWVHDFFVTHEVNRETFPKYTPEQWGFVPGFHTDNPYMEPEYEQTLQNLPPILRRQWLHGDWSAFDGQFFDFQARKHGQPWHVADLGLVA